MRRILCSAAIAVVAIAGFACRHDQQTPSESMAENLGIQIATDAYLAYQHSDCETVYRLTQPDRLDAMQATELRYSLRLVRGFCQELDGDQPAARMTYRRIIEESSISFAAEDARERIRVLDLLANDPLFANRVERASHRPRGAIDAREPTARPPALYPPLARASGVEGFAVVEFGIAPNGKTVDPIIVDSDPPFLFEATALRAVRGWEYKTKRHADSDQRQVIRIVFRTALEPAMVEDEAASTPPAGP